MLIKYKIYLNIIIIAVIFISLIFFGLKPLLYNVQTLAKQVEQQQIIIKDPGFQVEYETQILKLQADYQETAPKLSLLKQAMLKNSQAVDFIQILENAAQINNLKQQIRALPEQKNSLDFNLILFGNFPDFLRFLGYIENNKYLVEISNIKIRPLQDSNKLQSSLDIKAYVQD